jgi:sec-independent protein translocase protein TatB
MFDIGFSELVLIAVVALIVIGPERLPKVARTVGTLVGRMRSYVTMVKVEVEREMQLEDLKKLQQEIHQQQVDVLGTENTMLPVSKKENKSKSLTKKSASSRQTKHPL